MLEKNKDRLTPLSQQYNKAIYSERTHSSDTNSTVVSWKPIQSTRHWRNCLQTAQWNRLSYITCYFFSLTHCISVLSC